MSFNLDDFSSFNNIVLTSEDTNLVRLKYALAYNDKE
jgi:hypothetical protein